MPSNAARVTADPLMPLSRSTADIDAWLEELWDLRGTDLLLTVGRATAHPGRRRDAPRHGRSDVDAPSRSSG